MLRRRPKRLPGDTPLLRAWYRGTFGYDPDPRHSPYIHEHYLAILRARGVEPETGKMTEAGLAFFKGLLDAQNARHRGERGRHQGE